MHILIVEDNIKINHLITLYCNQEGYQTTSVFSAEDALKAVSEKKFDLVITDLMLKVLSGENFIKKIREKSDVYIIVVSAKADLQNRLEVLKLGADDYLTKPFSLEELILRIQNATSRIKQSTSNMVSFNHNHLRVSFIDEVVFIKDNLINLTQAEYQILCSLIKHPNQTLTREQIFEDASLDSEGFDRVIDAHIKNIRKKCLDDPKNPTLIKTIYGGGYKFVGEKDA